MLENANVGIRLPPQVEGEVLGDLYLCIPQIICTPGNVLPTETHIRVKFWGDKSFGSLFRPKTDQGKIAPNPKNASYFPIVSESQVLQSYLQDMAKLKLDIVNKDTHRIFGKCYIPLSRDLDVGIDNELFPIHSVSVKGKILGHAQIECRVSWGAKSSLWLAQQVKHAVPTMETLEKINGLNAPSKINSMDSPNGNQSPNERPSSVIMEKQLPLRSSFELDETLVAMDLDDRMPVEPKDRISIDLTNRRTNAPNIRMPIDSKRHQVGKNKESEEMKSIKVKETDRRSDDTERQHSRRSTNPYEDIIKKGIELRNAMSKSVNQGFQNSMDSFADTSLSSLIMSAESDEFDAEGDLELQEILDRVQVDQEDIPICIQVANSSKTELNTKDGFEFVIEAMAIQFPSQNPVPMNIMLTYAFPFPVSYSSSGSDPKVYKIQVSIPGDGQFYMLKHRYFEAMNFQNADLHDLQHPTFRIAISQTTSSKHAHEDSIVIGHVCVPMSALLSASQFRFSDIVEIQPYRNNGVKGNMKVSAGLCGLSTDFFKPHQVGHEVDNIPSKKTTLDIHWERPEQLLVSLSRILSYIPQKALQHAAVVAFTIRHTTPFAPDSKYEKSCAGFTSSKCMRTTEETVYFSAQIKHTVILPYHANHQAIATQRFGYMVFEVWGTIQDMDNDQRREELLGIVKYPLNSLHQLTNDNNKLSKRWCPNVGYLSTLNILNPFSGCIVGKMSGYIALGSAHEVNTFNQLHKAIVRLQRTFRFAKIRSFYAVTKFKHNDQAFKKRKANIIVRFLRNILKSKTESCQKLLLNSPEDSTVDTKNVDMHEAVNRTIVHRVKLSLRRQFDATAVKPMAEKFLSGCYLRYTVCQRNGSPLVLSSPRPEKCCLWWDSNSILLNTKSEFSINLEERNKFHLKKDSGWNIRFEVGLKADLLSPERSLGSAVFLLENGSGDSLFFNQSLASNNFRCDVPVIDSKGAVQCVLPLQIGYARNACAEIPQSTTTMRPMVVKSSKLSPATICFRVHIGKLSRAAAIEVKNIVNSSKGSKDFETGIFASFEFYEDLRRSSSYRACQATYCTEQIYVFQDMNDFNFTENMLTQIDDEFLFYVQRNTLTLKLLQFSNSIDNAREIGEVHVPLATLLSSSNGIDDEFAVYFPNGNKGTLQVQLCLHHDKSKLRPCHVETHNICEIVDQQRYLPSSDVASNEECSSENDNYEPNDGEIVEKADSRNASLLRDTASPGSEVAENSKPLNSNKESSLDMSSCHSVLSSISVSRKSTTMQDSTCNVSLCTKPFSMQFIIQEAKNLSMQHEYTMESNAINPYVQAAWSTSILIRSNVVRNNVHPKWKYAVIIQDERERLEDYRSLQILLQIWHQNEVDTSTDLGNGQTDLLIGESWIDLSPISWECSIDGWYHVLDKMNRQRGQVKISITPLPKLWCQPPVTPSSISDSGLLLSDSPLDASAISLPDTTTITTMLQELTTVNDLLLKKMDHSNSVAEESEFNAKDISKELIEKSEDVKVVHDLPPLPQKSPVNIRLESKDPFSTSGLLCDTNKETVPIESAIYVEQDITMEKIPSITNIESSSNDSDVSESMKLHEISDFLEGCSISSSNASDNYSNVKEELDIPLLQFEDESVEPCINFKPCVDHVSTSNNTITLHESDEAVVHVPDIIKSVECESPPPLKENSISTSCEQAMCPVEPHHGCINALPADFMELLASLIEEKVELAIARAQSQNTAFTTIAPSQPLVSEEYTLNTEREPCLQDLQIVASTEESVLEESNRAYNESIVTKNSNTSQTVQNLMLQSNMDLLDHTIELERLKNSPVITMERISSELLLPDEPTYAISEDSSIDAESQLLSTTKTVMAPDAETDGGTTNMHQVHEKPPKLFSNRLPHLADAETERIAKIMQGSLNFYRYEESSDDEW